uniref:Uncharacterized protein n=1 Tax=Rhizochromulina marina TaxID=1034831 RepID=A0A7S2WP71_9STRA
MGEVRGWRLDEGGPAAGDRPWGGDVRGVDDRSWGGELREEVFAGPLPGARAGDCAAAEEPGEEEGTVPLATLSDRGAEDPGFGAGAAPRFWKVSLILRVGPLPPVPDARGGAAWGGGAKDPAVRLGGACAGSGGDVEVGVADRAVGPGGAVAGARAVGGGEEDMGAG